MLATEHNRLQYDEECKFEPETLAKVSAKDEAADRHWTRESARSTTAQRTLQDIEALIEQEYSSLSTGLEKLSPDDPSLIAKAYRIGLLNNESHKYSEAISWLKCVIKCQQRAFGMDAEGVLEPTCELVQAFFGLNRLDEAIDTLRPVVLRALQQKNNRVVKSEYFVNAQISLGKMISMKMKRWSQNHGAEPTSRRELSREACEYLETGLRFFQDKYGPNSANAINCMVNLAVASGEASELHAAEEQLQEALRTRRADTQDPCDDFVRFLESELKTVFIEEGRFDEYEKLMLDSLQRLLSRFGTSSIYTLDQIKSLGFMYESSDRLDEARKLAVEHFDLLVTTGRLQPIPDEYTFGADNLGFTFGCKNLGFSCFEPQVSRLLESLKSHPGAEATKSEATKSEATNSEPVNEV